jgi:hypothetical protein
MSDESYKELTEQLAEVLREKLKVENQRNTAVAALDDVIALLEDCTITETPYGYRKTLSQAKEVLSTLQPASK